LPTAACPGSFDPVTNGHIDVITRAAALFDDVVVAVLVNPAKTSLFNVDERIAMLESCLAHLGNVTVASFDGLLVDFCSARGVSAIVKGLRAVTDFEYERQMAQMNRRLTGVDTLFLPAAPAYSFLASSLLKEVAAYGGDIAGLVPDEVLPEVKQRLAESSGGR
jgi:pantetheine-phosphate adenylyltransferase